MIYAENIDAATCATPKKQRSCNIPEKINKNINSKKILIVYYSLTGNTERVAGSLANELNADIEKIIDKKKRKGLWRYILAGRDGMLKKETVIEKNKKNPADYDIVVIGTPVWSWKMTPAVRTYINKFKNSFQETAFFITSGNTDAEKISREMEELCNKKAIASCGIIEKDLREENIKNYQKKIDVFIRKIIAGI
ncbi:MAG: hypothetical protein GY730_00260 [bacterium]|nr:hypothetical protein [bacterium]